MSELSTGESGSGSSLATIAIGAFKWSLAGQVAIRIGSLGLTLLLARLLLPKEYGAYAVALGVYAMLLTIDDLGLRQGLVRWPGDFAPAARVARTIGAVSGLVAYAIGFLLAPVIAGFASAPASADLMRVLFIGLIIDAATVIVPTAALDRQFRQKHVALAGVIGLAVDIIATFTLAIADHGAWALVWGTLIGQAVSALLLQAFSRVPFSYSTDRATARALIAVSLPLALASLVAVVILNVDYLLVGSVLGTSAVGVYVIAFNLANWPIPTIGAAVRSVAIPGFSRLRDAQEGIGSALSKGIVLLAMACVPFVVILTGDPTLVIQTLYGSEWNSGAEVVPFLAIAAVTRLIGGVVDDALFALGRSTTILTKNIIWLILLVPSIIVGLHADDLQGVGIAHAAVALVVLTGLVWTMRRALTIDGGTLRSGFGLVLLVSAVTAGVGQVARFITRGQDSIVRLGALGLLVVLAYSWTLWILRSRVREYLPPRSNTIPAVQGVGR